MSGNKSPLSSRLKYIVDDKFSSIYQDRIQPWALFNSGKPLIVENCKGKTINYEGTLEFSGSPREVFWNNYIEPCIKEAVVEVFCFIAQQCKDSPGLVPMDALDDGATLLKDGISELYIEMSKIDQRLRGKGFPNSVRPVDVSTMISRMNEYVEIHYNNNLDIIKAGAPSFYDKHKMVIWFIGIAITMGGIIINMLK